MDNEKTTIMSDYDSKVHKIGRISTLIILTALVLVPVLLTAVAGESIEIGPTLNGLVAILTLFVVVSIVEFISYAPILGAGAQYLSFITGNIMNMKIPASVSGTKLAGVEPGTPEADAVSVIATAVSSLVTTFILTIGMLLAAQLLPILSSESLAPAFSNLMPAIMGALMTPMLLKDLKTASLPCIVFVKRKTSHYTN